MKCWHAVDYNYTNNKIVSQLATIKCKLNNAQYCTKCVQKIMTSATTFSIK